MGQQVSKDDLRHAMQAVLDELRRGFDGVHERQDKTNGRIGTLEIEAGKMDVRTKNLERETFHTHRRATDPVATESDEKPIKRREVWLVAISLGAGAGILQFLAWLGSALKHVGKP